MFFHILVFLLVLTGALVWTVVFWSVFKPLPVALACTCSVLRCQWRAIDAAGQPFKWHRLPYSFMRLLVDMWGKGTPGRDVTLRGPNWTWRGIGNWEVHVPADEPNARLVKTAASSTPEQVSSSEISKMRETVVEGNSNSESSHLRFTVADWKTEVVNENTNEGYSAFVVNGCLANGLSLPRRFIKALDQEEDMLTQKDPTLDTSAFDHTYSRSDWMLAVQNDATQLGWRAWQLVSDTAKISGVSVA